MDTTRLYLGLLMVIPVIATYAVLLTVHTWRGQVQALHLRWDREQRQAAPAGVTLSQRQDVQARFETLVSAKPLTNVWYGGVLFVLLVALVLALAWELDALNWTALWLVAPLAAISLVALVVAWLVVRGGAAQLARVSASLYGPPPPRVKVRDLATTADPSSD